MSKLVLPVVLVTFGLLALLVTSLAAPLAVRAEPPLPGSPLSEPLLHHFTYLPTITRLHPPYADNFSNPLSGWPVGSGWPEPGSPYKSTWGYANGEYKISVGDWDWYYWADAPIPPIDAPYAVEVDMRRTAGAAAGAVTFDVQDDHSLYAFYVYPLNGWWELWRYNGSTDDWYLLDDGYDSHVLLGGARNHVRVERVGANITAYVNGYEVCTYGDDALSGGGVRLDAYANPYYDDVYLRLPAVMRFDNFRVVWLGPAAAQPVGGAAPAPRGGTTGLALHQSPRRR